MTEVHYVVLENDFGRYNRRIDRIEIHEGLKRIPQLLEHVLAHEWRHAEIRKNGDILLIITGLKSFYLDYSSLWEIYRNQEVLELYRKGVKELDWGEPSGSGLFLFLFTRICCFINWVESLIK